MMVHLMPKTSEQATVGKAMDTRACITHFLSTANQLTTGAVLAGERFTPDCQTITHCSIANFIGSKWSASLMVKSPFVKDQPD